MQNEAVTKSVRTLREHSQTASGGLPVGQARGKVILPCGTGKTRISLRIIEELTHREGLSIVLCPSIALVAQIRKEYLQHSTKPLRVMSVCSDQTAGYNAAKEERQKRLVDDPTADTSYVSASAVKGLVTTNPNKIADWITAERHKAKISIIFGTYQSGHKIAEALHLADTQACVLVCDEAHRTAGLRRKQVGSNELTDEDKKRRDFTLCHDNKAFPVRYRLYQTATPKIYGSRQPDMNNGSEWHVRSMDDETIFGVDLYRRSYGEAVGFGWLADYRIIALGVNDVEAYRQASNLAQAVEGKRGALTTSGYLKGLAFAIAMAGGTTAGKAGTVALKSCIGFMNTVKNSKQMAQDLQSDAVKQWVQNWLTTNKYGAAAAYRLEHLDASSNVQSREEAKRRLTAADAVNPHAIINVGIFGEGTDSPSLSAVAFLEPRKSPIDVIQAVGRAMRTAPGKQVGYIICPILIPPHADPETWLASSGPEDGWKELGDILLALRAHDQRIEDNLADLLMLYLPKPPEKVSTIVAVAQLEQKRITYGQHEGPPGQVYDKVETVLAGSATWEQAGIIRPIPEPPKPLNASKQTAITEQLEPTQIVSGKINQDGSVELRTDSPAREKPASDGTPGKIDIRKTKNLGKKMINEGAGLRVPNREQRQAQQQKRKQARERGGQEMLALPGLDELGHAISVNLLEKSGLTGNHVARDLNLLEESVREASFHLRSEGLQADLDAHFQIDQLQEGKNRADGCTIASLLMMNAAMLHQRIANGEWLNIKGLDLIASATNAVTLMRREWQKIMTHDFLPVFEPAVKAIEAVEDTGRLAGMERAVRHLASEAQLIAEAYADMGTDHAGPLFNRVMGDQASDGAYFTRPPAASLAAKLALDACDTHSTTNWADPEVWRAHKIIDLACGSGTLLAAIMTEMKRRAVACGANPEQISGLQRLAVEETIKGFDINPVSLQLAAAQLTASSTQVRYKKMGLHLMPYGSTEHGTRAGSLELLSQKAILPRPSELAIDDEIIKSRAMSLVFEDADDGELEDSVNAAQNARIVIMNPPFTNRSKLGEKFSREVQKALHTRIDKLEKTLLSCDDAMAGFVDKNALSPMFTALADRCSANEGVMAMVVPTVALCGSSSANQRQILASRYRIHSVITCHQPGNINLSQDTNINESILVVVRRNNSQDMSPARFINLDRLPNNEQETAELHQALTAASDGGIIANGWGQITWWPDQRVQKGDWSAALWRSPILAEVAAQVAEDEQLAELRAVGLTPWATGRLLRGGWHPSTVGAPGSIPILKSKGVDGQKRIEADPDQWWVPKPKSPPAAKSNMAAKAGHLLITAGQDTGTGRLTAVASEQQYVGNGWMPVAGATKPIAKALAVFLNSTVGRLQLMRHSGKKLAFPTYAVDTASQIRVPDISDQNVLDPLRECWEQTRKMTVPQYRDGECYVRRIWDSAVCAATGWEYEEVTEWRLLLHQEPRVRQVGYGQYETEEES